MLWLGFLPLLASFPAHEQPVHTIEEFQRNEARLAATQYQPKSNPHHLRLLMMNTLDRRMGAGHWWAMVERLKPQMAVCYGLVGLDQGGRLAEVVEQKGLNAQIELADDHHNVSWIFVSRHALGERVRKSFGSDLEVKVGEYSLRALIVALHRTVPISRDIHSLSRMRVKGKNKPVN